MSLQEGLSFSLCADDTLKALLVGGEVLGL